MPGGKVSNSPCCAVAPSPCCALVPSLTVQKNESMLWILKPFQYVIKLMLLSFVLMLLLCQFETGKQSLSIYWKHCSSIGKKENEEKIQTSIWYLKRNTNSPVLAAGSPTRTRSPLPAIVEYSHMSTTQKCSSGEQKSTKQRLSCHSSQAVIVLLSWHPTAFPSSGHTGTTFCSIRVDEHKLWTQT